MESTPLAVHDQAGEYPDVAINDVYITTLQPTGIEKEWAEPQMVSKNVIENLKMVKQIPIDEKIAFWQKVMQRAHDRGIAIYYFTWNVCPNGAANPVDPFLQDVRHKPLERKTGQIWYH